MSIASVLAGEDRWHVEIADVREEASSLCRGTVQQCLMPTSVAGVAQRDQIVEFVIVALSRLTRLEMVDDQSLLSLPTVLAGVIVALQSKHALCSPVSHVVPGFAPVRLLPLPVAREATEWQAGVGLLEGGAVDHLSALRAWKLLATPLIKTSAAMRAVARWMPEQMRWGAVLNLEKLSALRACRERLGLLRGTSDVAGAGSRAIRRRVLCQRLRSSFVGWQKLASAVLAGVHRNDSENLHSIRDMQGVVNTKVVVFRLQQADATGKLPAVNVTRRPSRTAKAPDQIALFGEDV